MSDDIKSSVQKKGGGGEAPIQKNHVFNEFVKFMAMADPDKAEMFGITFDVKKRRYERIPNLQDFAKKHGVHRNTLGAWKKREDFKKAVDAKQEQWGVDLLPNVMAALYRRCVQYGISTDVELFLAYYKKWDRRQVIKHIGEKFDLDDVRALIAPLPKEKQEHFYGLITEIITEAEVHRSRAEVQGDQLDLTGGNSQ